MGSEAIRGWPGRLIDRIRFERGARATYPGLRGTVTGDTITGGFRYSLTVDVPFYTPRRVTIVFPPRHSIPLVFADGPTESPHRYDNGSLCMWHPEDTAVMRWRFENGLLDLLDTTKAHLFREAWWREHDEWLGPEVHHPDISGAKEAA